MALQKEPAIRQKVDDLFNFYDANKPPHIGQRVEIHVTPKRLAQILGYIVPKGTEAPREQHYRGRILVAIGVERPRRKKTNGKGIGGIPPTQATI